MPDPDIEKLKAALELLRPIGGTKNETQAGPDPGWYWAGYGRSPVGPLVATAWRPLPPPPETADGR